jgi:ABC-type multidrug transport system ATPase subunit
MGSAVHLRAAVALLGRFPALAGVDLDVQPGEVVHLQGANGAGKTSLLRACAGLLPVVQGDAVVLGHDLRTAPGRRAVRTHVGLLGHAGFLYDDLTVEDNVRFAVRAAHLPTDHVDEALRRLGLHERLRAVPVGRLSAGQRRRTAFAVVVARQPRLWLLDEPHAGLDADARATVDDLIRTTDATVLLASHEAVDVADRTVVIAGGHVVPDKDHLHVA